jgi:hypothetical protein
MSESTAQAERKLFAFDAPRFALFPVGDEFELRVARKAEPADLEHHALA